MYVSLDLLSDVSVGKGSRRIMVAGHNRFVSECVVR